MTSARRIFRQHQPSAMATTKASPFDHTSMDKRLYYNLKLPALSSAFTRMVRSYMIHANSVGDITDQEAMTAEAFTDLLDDPIAWDLATAAAPVLKSQRYRLRSMLCGLMLTLFAVRTQTRPCSSLFSHSFSNGFRLLSRPPCRWQRLISGKRICSGGR